MIFGGISQLNYRPFRDIWIVIEGDEFGIEFRTHLVVFFPAIGPMLAIRLCFCRSSKQLKFDFKQFVRGLILQELTFYADVVLAMNAVVDEFARDLRICMDTVSERGGNCIRYHLACEVGFRNRYLSRDRR